MIKLGDKVRVYGLRPVRTGSQEAVYSRGEIAEVIEEVNSSEVVIRLKYTLRECEVHPKQLRRITKKDKK